jgi:hypothetical protein
MKKVSLLIALCMMVFSAQIFAGCGSCGGGGSHDEKPHSHHHEDAHSHSSKSLDGASCASCDKKEKCDSCKSKEATMELKGEASCCAVKKSKILAPKANPKYQVEVNEIMDDYYRDLKNLNKKYKKRLKKYTS